MNCWQWLSRTALAWILVFPYVVIAASGGSLPELTREGLRALFVAGHSNPIPLESLYVPGRLKVLYAQRGYEPLWIGPDGPRAEVAILIEEAQDARREGLAAEYHLTDIQGLMQRGELEGENATRLELLLSDAFLKLATDRYQGRFSPSDVDPQWQLEQPSLQPERLMIKSLEQGRLRETLDSLAPNHPRYLAMRSALEGLWRIAEEGGWPALPAGPSLEAGDRDARVVLLRERLHISGDLQIPPRDSEDLFDAGLASAVRFFQTRHGLEVDGIVGPHTRAALNVPVEKRIDQLIINLERWYWLPRELGPRHILVNMAGFELELFEEGHPPLWMRAIVGKTYRQTPTFSGRLTYLVVNPTWTIPARILKLDIAPRLNSNPDYLAQQRIRIFDGWKADADEIGLEQVDWSRVGRRYTHYRFRQEPGPANALGRIKFMLQNPYDIYLHDTPRRELFKEAVRTFSSGCIRLEKPVELAQRLLAMGGADAGQLEQSLESGKTRNLGLQKAVPVYFVYMTAWVDGQGVLQFRKDVYKRNKVMEATLFESRGG
ncbi:murein L,D-transpeptidase [Pseudomonadota bacterium]